MTPAEHRRMNTVILATLIVLIGILAYDQKQTKIDMVQCETMLYEKLFNSDYPLAVKKEK